MGFRCELCDDWLPMLSFSKLCPICYKLRTIVKCYNANDILKNAEEHFLVSHAREEELKTLDKKFFIEEEARIQKDFEEELASLQQQEQQYLETIKEEELDECAGTTCEDPRCCPPPIPLPPLTNDSLENTDKSYMTRNKNKKNKKKNNSL